MIALLDERKINILQYLLKTNRITSGHDVAKKFRVSEKTVRNDLQEISKWLQVEGELKLIRRPGVGVYISGTEEEKRRALQQLQQVSRPAHSFDDPQMRKLQIIRYLLQADQPVTIRQLATLFYVSQASIYADLIEVEKWLAQHGLQLVRKSNLGVQVAGDEKNWRLALSDITEQLARSPFPTSQWLDQAVFDFPELPTIEHRVRMIERSLPHPFSEEAFTNLVIHIAIALKRIKQRKTIAINPAELNRLKSKPEYRFARELAHDLEKAFAVKIPESELGYLTIHFMGAKVRQSSRESGEEIEHSLEQVDEEALDVTRRLIGTVSHLLELPLDQDQTLTLGLALHLHSALNRLRHGLRLSNPLLGQIKETYRYMFETILSVLPPLEQDLKLQFPEEEAAYLTLHFQAALERMNEQQEEKKVLLVCTTGLGTSQLLAAKIRRLFPSVRIVDTVSTYEAVKAVQHWQPNFIISTVPIQIPGVPSALVTPIIGKEEQELIESLIRQPSSKQDNESFYPTLLAMLKRELIFLDVNAKNRADLISFLADQLAERGYVEPGYKLSALERERISSTAIGGGIAIPHAPYSLVKKSALAVARLDSPVSWGDDQVSLVWMIACSLSDKEKMKPFFEELADLVEDEARLHLLLQQNQADDFIRTLQTKEV
ncbi:activator of the mannose operon, transcriptional antiterminator [Lihuaxuella thermophila]|uniref:Activator of the mannose operon, transcriptional antiterminator n=2 Tax=Lihuaxuella thermophila TaxID=1173111 RepID=A0A1H8DZV1_9BACL|nr:PRD domain-containing protein [Lihuaxuella thermophila]SEN12851.1 activator of the mannose operon, transcriptional antiterminator [Lihuaxuella thermophila]